ncbi:MAG: CHAT domain-containing protein [Bryobacterales bacterium]|nr:CHAT domain-containing protein [Bryobacterales bacterium]
MAPRLPILLLLAAVALYAETPAQQCNRAWVLIQQHKHLEAFQLLKTTIRENPTFVRAYRLVGDACGPGACREEALQFLSAAGPGPREVALGHYGRGSVYAANPAYSKGGLAPALREFAACIRVDPSRAECYPGVGGSLQAVAPATLTLRHAERLAPIDPHNPATRLLEGRILNLARKLEQAQQVLRQGLAVALAQKDEDLAALYYLELSGSDAALGSAGPQQNAQWLYEYAIRVDAVDLEFAMLLNGATDDASPVELTTGAGKFRQALARAQELGAWNPEVHCLRMIAKQHEEAGDLAAARQSLLAARQRCASGLNQTCAPDVLLELANVERAAGSSLEALRTYEEARTVARTVNLAWQEAMACRGIANIYADLGEYFKSLEWGTLSVQGFQQIGHLSPAAASSANLGDIHAVLGDFSSAQRAYRASLTMARSYVDKGEESRTLIAMGMLALRAGQPAQALPSLVQGQRIIVAERFRPFQVLASTAMARGLLRLGRPADALVQAQAAATLAAELHAVKPEAEALAAVGDCLLNLRRPSQAAVAFLRSLSLAESAGHLPVAVQARRGLAQAQLQQGNLQQALQHYRRAIEELESIRGALPAASQRSGLLEQNWVYYNETVSLLARLHARQPNAGFDRLALSYAERARVRTLFEDLAEARAAQSALPAPLDAEQIQASLAGTSTAILEFSLGDARSQAWLITAAGVSMFALPPRAAIAETVTRYRAFITTRPKTQAAYDAYTATARELHQTLIAPLSRQLAGLSNLTIVPDGALHYLPFETLIASPAGQPPRFLIEDLAIHYAPSASILAALLAAKPSPPAAMDLLAYGDPLYSRNAAAQVSAPDLVRRVYESAGARFPQLPNTRVELNRIGALFPAARERLLLGAEANEASVKSEQLPATASSTSPPTPSSMRPPRSAPASSFPSPTRAGKTASSGRRRS